MLNISDGETYDRTFNNFLNLTDYTPPEDSRCSGLDNNQCKVNHNCKLNGTFTCEDNSCPNGGKRLQFPTMSGVSDKSGYK